jgi:subtilisin family serine protease
MDPDKLHPTLREMIEPDTVAKGLREGTPVPTELPVIVRYRAATPRSARAQAAPAGWSFELTNSTAMTVDLQELGQLTEDPNVALVWPDLPVYALLNDSVPVIRAPEVWSLGYAGRGVTIAIIDTGIDSEHPDLVGRVIDQKDFTGEGPGDGNGHGTHVASIAAGSGAASQGRYRGVAPEASLLAVRVLGSNGSGRQSNVMAGIEWAIERGAKIINLSLGGPPEPGDGTDALSAQVDAAVRAGVVCVVAAGNSGPSARTVGSPGSAHR